MVRQNSIIMQRMKKVGLTAGVFLLTYTFSQAQLKSVEEMPLQLFPQQKNSSELVVFVTGDGGWNTFSQKMCKTFVGNGCSVIALNSKKYFWSAKTPKRFADDLEKVIIHYMEEWKKSSCIIAGYSFGADVVAFLPKRLSAKLVKKISLIALVSPGSSSDFEIHLSDLLSDKDPVDRTYKTKPEIEQSLLHTVCIFGKEENLMLKNELKETTTLSVVELPGPHHFNNDTGAIVTLIQNEVRNK